MPARERTLAARSVSPWESRRRYGGRHVLGAVGVREVNRGVVRIVGAWEADHQREGAVVAVGVDEAPGLAPRVPVPGVLPWHVRMGDALTFEVLPVLLPAQLPEPMVLQVVVVVVANEGPELVLADDAVLETVPSVPGVEVHLADCSGVVAGGGEYLRPGADAGARVVRSQSV